MEARKTAQMDKVSGEPEDNVDGGFSDDEILNIKEEQKQENLTEHTSIVTDKAKG